MKYIIDACTPVLHISLNIVCLLYDILTPLIYIILRPTGKFYNCQPLYFELVGSYAGKTAML